MVILPNINRNVFLLAILAVLALLPQQARAIDIDLSSSLAEGSNSTLTVTFSSATPGSNDFEFGWTIYMGSGNLDPYNDFSSYAGYSEKVPSYSTSYSLNLPLVDDSTSEGTETGHICLVPMNDSAFPPGTWNYTADFTNGGGEPCWNISVTDNDTPPTIAFASASSANAEGVSSASIPVSLSSSWTSAITVNYTVSGTATGSGTDYTLANGTLSFAAGTTTLPIVISNIVDDNIYEGDETIILTLSSPTVASLGSTTTHTYTITENETVPTLSIADISNAEGAFGVNAQPNLAVTLSHPSSRSVSFNWATQDGTATSADSDYDTDSGTLYISSGATSVNVSPVIFGDDAFENNENFSIILSSPSNATIADGTGVVTITNDDSQPTISVTLNGMAVEGGGNATLRVAPDVVAGVDISFSYTTSDGSATAGSEYTTTSGSATITAGSSDVDIQVPLTDNAIDNSNTDFTFTISSPTNATIGTASETVTILDDEGVVSIGDIAVNETDSTASFTVTVQGPIMSSSVDVDFTTVDGSATAGADYVTKSGTLQFTSSDAAPFTTAETQTITVTLSDDALVEGDENFDISLSNIVSAGSLVMPDNTGRATITDNDAATLDFNTASSSGAESVSSASLQVDLSTQSASAITVDYAVTGTATGGGTDYTLADGTLTIPANSSSATITIASIVDDALVEGDETVIVTLSNPSGATLGSDTVHSYTITDNDAAVIPVASLSAAASVSEGAGTHNFTVSLSSAATSAVSVDYATSNGTALATSDFTAISNTLNFAIGETSKTITVTILDDSVSESSESFSLALSNPSGLTLGTSSVTVSITDDDDSGTSETELKAAETFVQEMSDQLAQSKGNDLIEASHRLIRSSLDSLIIKSRISVGARTTGASSSETGFTDADATKDTARARRQAFFAQPETPIMDREERLARNVIGAIKTVDVTADEDSHNAMFDYDLYTPLVRNSDRLITKIAAQTSKQKNGPEARRLIASFALEKQAADEQSAAGKFVHLTHEKADFNTDYKGDKKTNSVNIGVYKVYTADVDVMNSVYFSAGIGNTDLSLKKDGMLLDSSYLSYQFQTGFSVGHMHKAKGFLGILEFSVDGLYDYQTGHQLNITSGLSKFNRLISGKGRYEIIGRLEPKLNFEFGSDNLKKRNLQISPLLKCGTGSMKADCGGGLAANISTPMEAGKGHLTFGLRYEHYRDTDFMEYLVNINQYLFNNDNIKLNTEVKLDTDDASGSVSPQDYSVGSSLNITF